MRLLAADMHDIERHAGRIRDADRAVGGLALEFRGAGIGVPFGAGNALFKVFLLHLGHQIAVFSMDHWQRAQFRTALERGEHLVILDHQRALVGHEMLEGIDAHIDGILHLLKDVLIPAGDGHVIADIAANLRGRFAVPFIDGIPDRSVGARQAEIHQHRGAATGRGPCACLERFGRGGAHEGHFQMGMGIDPAGDHIGIRGVDIFIAFQILADLFDRLAVDQNVCLPRAVGGTDGATLDDFGRHDLSP